MTYTKTICLTINIQGDYTNKIDQIKQIENIPENTLVSAKYDAFTDTTVLACIYNQKVDKSIE